MNKQKEDSNVGSFIFSIVMMVIVFILAIANAGPKGHASLFPSIIWGYQAWLIHKKNYKDLVSLNKLGMWIIGVATVFIIFYLLSYGNDDTLGFDLLIEVILAFLIYFAMHQHFKKKELARINTEARKINTERAGNDSDNKELSLYLNAINQFEGDGRDKGLWAKCLVDADGDQSKAQAAYIRITVEKTNLELNKYEEDIAEKETDNFSAQYLVNNKMYHVREHKKRKYALLNNKNAAVKVDGVIVVYINEEDCKKAIDKDNFQIGYKIAFKANQIIF